MIVSSAGLSMQIPGCRYTAWDPLGLVRPPYGSVRRIGGAGARSPATRGRRWGTGRSGGGGRGRAAARTARAPRRRLRAMRSARAGGRGGGGGWRRRRRRSESEAGRGAGCGARGTAGVCAGRTGAGGEVVEVGVLELGGPDGGADELLDAEFVARAKQKLLALGVPRGY